MKIKKLNESILKEADENVTVVNSEDSGQEVLNKVEKEAEENGIEINSAEVAGEIAGDADKINSEETIVDFDEDTSLGVENFITKALDKCVKTTERIRRKGLHEVANIMICGLPGSGKTASVYDWASHATDSKGRPVNITYLNMKNNDLDAFINGYTVQSKEDPDYVAQAFSRNLDGLEQENSILFLDEYNRQTEAQIRASVLTLINEHYIVGKGKGGKRYFPNFLFTIAVMNPAIRTDRGAAELNDAEKSRFLYFFDNVDSDPETTIEYLNKQYTKLVKKELEKSEPDFDEIEEDLRILDLGTFICEDDTFEYDSKDKLSDLARTGKKMLNQRSLTAGLLQCGGDVDEFKDWLIGEQGKGGANFLDNASTGQDNTTEMLIEILNGYTAPTREELFAQAGIKENKPETDDTEDENAAAQNANDATNTNAEASVDQGVDSDAEDDDDPDFWANAGAGNAGGVNSPSEIDNIFNDFASTWDK